MHIITLHAVALASIATASSSAQSVFVVDDNPGPGVNFTDLQPAVDVAGPLDRIEVRHGDYGAVIIDHGVTIIGEPFGSAAFGNDAETAAIIVRNLPAGETVVVADLRSSTSYLEDSDGVVLLDGLRANRVFIERCGDVRLQSFEASQPPSIILSRIDCVDSFVQLIGLSIRGSSSGSEQDGRPAVNAVSSTLIVADCEIVGGIGGDQSLCFGGYIGMGGPAIKTSGSTVRVLGSTLEGGHGGYSCFSVFPVGPDGVAVEFAGAASSFIGSSSSFTGGSSGFGSVLNVPGLPWVALDGDQEPGGTASLRFHAAGGSSLRGFLGRRAVMTPVAGLAVPLLQSGERGVSLGSTPAGGLLVVPWTIPVLNPGTLIHLQSSRTDSGGATELSNAVTLVVR